MQRVSASITDTCVPWPHTLRQSQDSDSERLASLAELMMVRQSPGLVIPSLGSAPTSFNHTGGNDTAISLSRSLVQLGLGSADIWTRNNANPELFVRDSLNKWLVGLGADKLHDSVNIDFAVVDSPEDVEDKKFDSKLFAILETHDGCGALFLGQVLRALEQHSIGLGRAFYIVLNVHMNRWLYLFDVGNAEYFIERWKEGIEMDMDPESDLTFEEHCKAEEIEFPDPHSSMPAFLKNISYYKEFKRLKRSTCLLTQHRAGPFAALIEPLLTLTKIKQEKFTSNVYEEIRDSWDDNPLPNWIVAFEAADPIMQAFDEESQSMYETSHAPSWVESFDPADVNDVGRILAYVKGFVEVNQQVAKIQQFAENWSRSHASQRSTELNDHLRAA